MLYKSLYIYMISTTLKRLENYCASERSIYSEFVGVSAQLHCTIFMQISLFVFFFLYMLCLNTVLLQMYVFILYITLN